MLGTSTHDTKRGEDTRARLNVLSEMPDEWERQIKTWSRMVRARRGDMAGTAPPDKNDEYLLYQLLIGSWPAELTNVTQPDASLLKGYIERVEGAMIKSIREAKVHSTWAAPNTEYEEAVIAFLHECLDVTRRNPFLEAFVPFQAQGGEAGSAQRPCPGVAEADRPRRAGYLPGFRDVEPQSGRSRQPPARRLRNASAGAGAGGRPA